MKGWTLEYIADLDEDIYHELIDWINDCNKTEDDDSIDVDVMLEAKRKAREREAQSVADPFSADAAMQLLIAASRDIKREVGTLVDPAAREMAARLVARYPRGRREHPGRKHMKDDVRVKVLNQDEAELPARKVIGPRLASVWQDGTGQRHDGTRKNANRGRMPAADPHFFERTAVSVRTQMLQRAQVILDKNRTI